MHFHVEITVSLISTNRNRTQLMIKNFRRRNWEAGGELNFIFNLQYSSWIIKYNQSEPAVGNHESYPLCVCLLSAVSPPPLTGQTAPSPAGRSLSARSERRSSPRRVVTWPQLGMTSRISSMDAIPSGVRSQLYKTILIIWLKNYSLATKKQNIN